MKNLLDHRLNEVSKITCTVSSIVSASGRYSISRCVAQQVQKLLTLFISQFGV